MKISAASAKLAFTITLLSSLQLLSATANAQNRTVDGRFGSKCMPWIQDSKRSLCSISFYKLIAKPEAYQNKLISASSYLINMFGYYVLFPSKNSYESGVDVEGVELLNDKAIPLKLRKESVDGVFPVRVVGVFDAKFGGSGDSPLQLLGAFKQVEVVKYAPRINSGESNNHLW